MMSGVDEIQAQRRHIRKVLLDAVILLLLMGVIVVSTALCIKTSGLLYLGIAIVYSGIAFVYELHPPYPTCDCGAPV